MSHKLKSPRVERKMACNRAQGYADRIRWLLSDQPNSQSFAAEMLQNARNIMESIDVVVGMCRIDWTAPSPAFWRSIEVMAAPTNRPIGLLSMQPQPAGGTHVTLDICQWNGECFEIGLGFKSGVGHGCATHWCEVSDLRLPALTSSDGGVEGHAAVPLEIPAQRSGESRDPLGDGSVKVGPHREDAAGIKPGPSEPSPPRPHSQRQ